MEEKILTHVKNSVTGEVYYIGTRGQSEEVSISLSSETDLDFTKFKVVVYIYGESTQTMDLVPSSQGECSFSVEHGLKYSVVLPAITTDGYNEMASKFNYTSSLASRTINRFYEKDKAYESLVVTIQALGEHGGVYGAIDGQTLEVVHSDGTVQSAVISNDTATVQIPVGISYTINPPSVTGYVKTFDSSEHIATVGSRIVYIYYRDYSQNSIYGVGINGEPYMLNGNGKYETLDGTELSTEEAASVVKYIAINPSTLAESQKHDGTTGCGFLVDVNLAVASKSWAVEQLSYYDETDVVGSPYLPFCSSHALAYAQPDGQFYTDEILRVAPRVHATYSIKNPTVSDFTPAATYARTKTITVNGVVKRGFLLSYRQLYAICANLVFWKQVWSALGKTAPAINSDRWWSSCQLSATNAVNLGNGGFLNYFKTNSYSVLVGFDL